MIRVLLSAEVLHGPATGVQRYAIELAWALARRSDLEITALVPDEKAAGLMPSNVARRVVPMSVLAGIVPWASRPVREFDGFDVVHCLSARVPFFRRIRPGTVMTIHDVIPLIVRRSHDWKYRTYFRSVLPRILKDRIDHVIAVSDATRNDVIQLLGVGAAQITTIPEASRWAAIDRPEEKRPFFLSLGTSEPRKNHRRVVDAFIEFKTNHPSDEHRLVIAGASGWGTSADTTHAHIEQRGYVTDQQLRDLLAHATALVYPSLYEGFGLPVLEAMALGCPVITSRRGAIPEVAGDAARYADPESVTSIAGAIGAIAADATLAAALAQRGLERARLFSWDRCAAETAAVYASLVAHNVAAPA